MPVPHNQTAVRALLGAHGFSPSGLRGQNFLVDRNLIDFILRRADVGPDDCVLEVGTGTGILTDALAGRAARVISCDLDARLQRITRGLRAWPESVRFIPADILASKHELNPAVIRPWTEAGGRLRVVANLPYAVATPFLANLLWQGVPFVDALVLVQKEVAQRLTARPNTPEYGAVSVAVALLAQAEIVRPVSPRVFWPQPRVTSALLFLRPLDPAQARRWKRAGLEALLQEAFGQRRKTLRKRFGETRLEAAGIDPGLRAEQVPPEAWPRLLTVPPV